MGLDKKKLKHMDKKKKRYEAYEQAYKSIGKSEAEFLKEESDKYNIKKEKAKDARNRSESYMMDDDKKK